MHILRCMGSKSCVKFQGCPLKFHTKFWTHTPQNMHLTEFYFSLWFTISWNCDVISLSETAPWNHKNLRYIKKGDLWLKLVKMRLILQYPRLVLRYPPKLSKRYYNAKLYNIIRQCLDSEPHHWNRTNDYVVYAQYVNRHCLGGTNNPCSTTSLQCVWYNVGVA